MRIAMTGANGFVGTYLSRNFVSEGHEVVRLGREHLASLDVLEKALQGCDVVINLAGASIAQRWSEEHKKAMIQSRIATTTALIEAFHLLAKKPSVFISTSAVGIYQEGLRHDDTQATYGIDFLADLARKWEKEALKAQEMGIRTVIFRFGVVLGQGGGALAEMLPIFKLGLGGKIGNGEQAFSWVHIDDLRRAYDFVIKDASKKGTYNMTAPKPVTNKIMTQKLARVLDKPAIFPVPAFALKLRFGEGASILLKGQEVYPSRLLDEGFVFNFTDIENAFKSILDG